MIGLDLVLEKKKNKTLKRTTLTMTFGQQADIGLLLILVKISCSPIHSPVVIRSHWKLFINSNIYSNSNVDIPGIYLLPPRWE